MPPRSDNPPPVSAVVQQYAQLLALAAHELRTPASVVSGYLRMLQMDDSQPLSDRQRHLIDEAAKSCGRLVGLIGELSEVGSLDTGAVPATPEAFDLFSTLDGVATGVHEGEDREVRLQLTGVSDGATIRGDRRRIARAFDALFRTVLREQPAACTVVGDRRLVRHADATWACIVIAHDADVQRAADGPAQPLNEKRGGVGLSLPIARRVIEQQGGRIWSPAPEHDDDRRLRGAIVVSLPLEEQ